MAGYRTHMHPPSDGYPSKLTFSQLEPNKNWSLTLASPSLYVLKTKDTNIILRVALDLISKYKSLQQWKADYTVLCCQNLVLHANKQHCSNLQHSPVQSCSECSNTAATHPPTLGRLTRWSTRLSHHRNPWRSFLLEGCVHLVRMR